MSEIVPHEGALSGEVVTSTLGELLDQANQEHQLVGEALGQALDHVIRAGAVLTDARNNFVGYAGWEKWVEQHFEGGRTVAGYYMRIYAHRELVADLPNVNQAMKRLQGMPALRKPGYGGYSEELREEARALYGSGMSQAEVGRILGISRVTIGTWVDPQALQKHRKRTRELNAKLRTERAQKKKEAANRAAEREARRVGGALAEAYSLVHKLEAPLAQAEREAIDPEVKKALEEAGSFQRRALYRIVEALGAS